MLIMDKNDSIYIAGHRGMVGSAIVRRLRKEGFDDLVVRTHKELDLCDQWAVAAFFKEERPEYVFLAAAKVGGILANSRAQAEFIHQNLQIELNVIHECYRNDVKKLLFLGSSCIYPKFAPQPIPESALLTGSLEHTNYGYAVAKIAGIKMCQAYNEQYGTNFISCMPTNLYGPNDNYDPEGSHAMAALIRKFHLAKANGEGEVVVWGTGKPRREFMYVNDLAEACLFLMERYDESETVNVGTGRDITIHELAELMADIVGFEGEIVYNPERPDGTPQKLLDVSRINKMGWKARTSLDEGIRMAYADFLKGFPQ